MVVFAYREKHLMKTSLERTFCYGHFKAEAIIEIDKDKLEVERVDLHMRDNYGDWYKIEKPESDQKFYDWICDRMDEEIEKHDWSAFK